MIGGGCVPVRANAVSRSLDDPQSDRVRHAESRSIALAFAGGVDTSASTSGSGIGVAVGLLLATLVAPVPVLATTVLYFELRDGDPAPARMDPFAPSAVGG